ncbi:pimeloyl-ACP methyl ester esterase BioH [Agaribacter flavus]|uniref:Pimeloyl-[acyl-carrier protein] methyl ester esterase n=1 Tax=Agaribacter flavus TaxID=1902781 RepID=A0ABV7FVS0_9ALTE
MLSKQAPPTKSTEFNIVFIHGWGMNKGVWEAIFPQLDKMQQALREQGINGNLQFVDLLGYGERAEVGKGKEVASFDLQSLCDDLNLRVPKNAILVGWSLGGLVASQLAVKREDIMGLVTVSSSPKFAETEDWPGIKVDVLKKFKSQLVEQTQSTIKRFIAIQNMGIDNQRQQNKLIQDNIFKYPAASGSALSDGLDILLNEDLRSTWSRITCPHLAIFGYLDSLVPRQVIPYIQACTSHTEVEVLRKAAHAPFLSHTEAFIASLQHFLLNLAVIKN